VLLTVTTTASPATDLGYLLHKHPARAQSFGVASGTAHVFFPEASPGRRPASEVVGVGAGVPGPAPEPGLAGSGESREAAPPPGLR